MKLSRNVLTFFMILFFVYCTVPQDSARDLFPSKTTGHTGEWLSDGDTAIKIGSSLFSMGGWVSLYR